MGAYGANFNISRQAKPLSGHGDETAPVEYAEEGAKFKSAEMKRAGLGQCGQVHHGARIGRSEWAHLCLKRKQMGLAPKRRGADHLVEQAAAQQGPTRGGRGRLVEKQTDDALRPRESAKVFIALFGLIGNAAQRAYFRREAASRAMNERQGTVAGVERIKDGIVKQRRACCHRE
jgi:hypothetical protein